MLKQASFKNFKSLRDVTIPLQPLTLLVGPNGSGLRSRCPGPTNAGPRL